MSDLNEKVQKLISETERTSRKEEATAFAVAAAKPGAFKVLVEKSREAVEIINSRSIPPEATKQTIVDQIPHKKWLSNRTIWKPIKGDVSGWLLYQSDRSVDYGNSDYNMGPSWQQGILVDTQGKLYSFHNNDATPLESFDKTIDVIGSTPAFTLERVRELAEFWEDKVAKMVARVILREPYTGQH